MSAADSAKKLEIARKFINRRAALQKGVSNTNVSRSPDKSKRPSPSAQEYQTDQEVQEVQNVIDRSEIDQKKGNGAAATPTMRDSVESDPFGIGDHMATNVDVDHNHNATGSDDEERRSVLKQRGVTSAAGSGSDDMAHTQRRNSASDLQPQIQAAPRPVMQCTVRNANNERVPTQNMLPQPGVPVVKHVDPNKAEFLRKNRAEVEAVSSARAEEEATTASDMVRDLSGLLGALAEKEKSLVAEHEGSKTNSGHPQPTTVALETSRNTQCNSETPPRGGIRGEGLGYKKAGAVSSAWGGGGDADESQAALEILRRRKQHPLMFSGASARGIHSRPLSSPDTRGSRDVLLHRIVAAENPTQVENLLLPAIGGVSKGGPVPMTRGVVGVGGGGLPSIHQPGIATARPRSTGALLGVGSGRKQTQTTATYMQHTVRSQLEEQIHDTYKNKIGELKRQLEAAQNAKDGNSGGGAGGGYGSIAANSSGHTARRGKRDDDSDMNSDILSMVLEEGGAAGGAAGRKKGCVVKGKKKRKGRGKKKKKKVEGGKVSDEEEEKDRAEVDVGKAPIATVASVTAEVNRMHQVEPEPVPASALASSLAQDAYLSNEDWLNQLMYMRRSLSQGNGVGGGGVNMGASRPDDRDQQSMYYNHHTPAQPAPAIALNRATRTGAGAETDITKHTAAAGSKSGSCGNAGGRYSGPVNVKSTKPPELVRTLGVGGTSISVRPERTHARPRIESRKEGPTTESPAAGMDTVPCKGGKMRREASSEPSDIPSELMLPDFTLSGKAQGKNIMEGVGDLGEDEVGDSSTDDLIFVLNGNADSNRRVECGGGGGGGMPSMTTTSIGGGKRPESVVDTADYLGRSVCTPHGITDCSLCELRNQNQTRAGTSVLNHTPERTGTAASAASKATDANRKVLSPPRVDFASASAAPHASICVTLSPNAGARGGTADITGGTESPIRIDVRNSYMQSREEVSGLGAKEQELHSKIPIVLAGVAAAEQGAEPLVGFHGYSPGKDRALLNNFSSLSPSRPRRAGTGAGACPSSVIVQSPGLQLGGTTASVLAAKHVVSPGPVGPTNTISKAEKVNLGFFDTTSTAEKGRFILNSARKYHSNSITRKPDMLALALAGDDNGNRTASDASGGEKALMSSPGIILLCGRHKETNKENILTILFDRTVYQTEESAVTWWELNRARLQLIYC